MKYEIPKWIAVTEKMRSFVNIYVLENFTFAYLTNYTDTSGLSFYYNVHKNKSLS